VLSANHVAKSNCHRCSRLWRPLLSFRCVLPVVCFYPLLVK